MVDLHNRGRCGGRLDGKYELPKEQAISSTGQGAGHRFVSVSKRGLT